MGFFEAFDRPFDPIADGSYTGIGIETLRDSIGRTEANLLVAGAAVLGVGLLVLTTLALLRLTRVAAGHRRWSLPAVAALGVVWVLCWAVRRAARLLRAHRLHERRRPGLPRGPRGAGRRPGPRGLRRRHPPRPLPRHPCQPAAERPARQGRPAHVRRELRQGRRPGLRDRARGRRCARPRAPGGCRPPASPRAAPSSPRRRSAGSAGSRTRRCSRGPGSTISCATTSSSRATA